MAWEIVYPIGAVLLLLGIAWAVWRNSRRSPREKAISEAAAREMQKHPESYEQGGRQALEAEADKVKAEQREADRGRP